MILRDFDGRKRRPDQWLHPKGRVDGRRKVAGKEAPLQLASPIPALGKCQVPITRQTAYDPTFIELLVIERAESATRPSQHSDQRKLCRDDVDDEFELHLLRQRQSLL